MSLPGHFTTVKYYCGEGVKRKKKERKEVEKYQKWIGRLGFEPNKFFYLHTLRPIGGETLRLSPNH